MHTIPCYRHYLLILVVSFILFSGGVVGWHVFVDPYDVFTTTRKHGFNHYTSLISGDNQRMVKAHQLKRERPDGLVLGTSRADWGLDTGHALFVESCERPYNAALGGCTIYEAFRYFLHARHLEPLKTIVIGLDMEMFTTALTREDGFDRRLLTDEAGVYQPMARFADGLVLLFSQDALDASRKVRRQSRKNKDVTYSDMHTRGSAYWENLIPPEKSLAAFRAREREGHENLYRIYRHTTLLNSRMKWLEKLLQHAHEDGSRVYLFITPYHAALLDHMAEERSWATFEHWKREIVRINEEVAAKVGRVAFPCWDFSGYHAIALEAPPSERHPLRLMPHYVECSHYRKKMGDIVLTTLHTGAPARAGIGHAMTSASIDAHLATLREAAQQRWATLR